MAESKMPSIRWIAALVLVACGLAGFLLLVGERGVLAGTGLIAGVALAYLLSSSRVTLITARRCRGWWCYICLGLWVPVAYGWIMLFLLGKVFASGHDGIMVPVFTAGFLVATHFVQSWVSKRLGAEQAGPQAGKLSACEQPASGAKRLKVIAVIVLWVVALAGAFSVMLGFSDQYERYLVVPLAAVWLGGSACYAAFRYRWKLLPEAVSLIVWIWAFVLVWSVQRRGVSLAGALIVIGMAFVYLLLGPATRGVRQALASGIYPIAAALIALYLLLNEVGIFTQVADLSVRASLFVLTLGMGYFLVERVAARVSLAPSDTVGS